MPTVLIALAFLVWTDSTLSAQTSTDWTSLKGILTPGTRVRVDLAQRRHFEGNVIAVTDTALSLARKAGTTTVDKADVVRVYRLVGRSSHRNTWLGAGVGAAVGVAALALSQGGDLSDLESGAFPVIGAIGAGVGALIGHSTRAKFELIEVYSLTKTGASVKPQSGESQ